MLHQNICATASELANIMAWSERDSHKQRKSEREKELGKQFPEIMAAALPNFVSQMQRIELNINANRN